jgi:hypothetical protein
MPYHRNEEKQNANVVHSLGASHNNPSSSKLEVQMRNRKKPSFLKSVIKGIVEISKEEAKKRTTHSSDTDVRASVEILDNQLQVYEDLPHDAEGLCSVCLEPRKDFVDIAGRFAWYKGEVTFSFGKHKGRPVREIVDEYPDYLGWILSQDFSPEVMNIVKNALEGEFPERTL